MWPVRQARFSHTVTTLHCAYLPCANKLDKNSQYSANNKIKLYVEIWLRKSIYHLFIYNASIYFIHHTQCSYITIDTLMIIVSAVRKYDYHVQIFPLSIHMHLCMESKFLCCLFNALYSLVVRVYLAARWTPTENRHIQS